MAQPNIQEELIKLLEMQVPEPLAFDLNPLSIGHVQPPAFPPTNGLVAIVASIFPARIVSPEFTIQQGNLLAVLATQLPVILVQAVAKNGTHRY